MTSRALGLCLFAAIGLVGCDDDAGGVLADIGRPDFTPPVEDATLARDMTSGPDASLGQPCADGEDCPSGFCVAFEDRRVCSDRCGNDDDCPAGWLCRQVSNTGPDVTFICVPEESPCAGADLQNDPLNCGACDRACAHDFAESLCAAGACAMGACLEGHHDLNGSADDGCEYACVVTRDGVEECDAIDNDCDGATDEGFDLATDPLHCGGCGAVCARANAETRCADGACETVACLDGFADLDGDAENGCEGFDCVPRAELCDGADDDCDDAVDEDFDLAADAFNCGQCGVECARDEAVTECVDGACVLRACTEGYVDLDGDFETGCECRAEPERCNALDDDCDGVADEVFDLRNDPTHCGACGRICRFADGLPVCVDGACVLAGCVEGFVDRDGDPANGCECRPAVGGEVCNGADDDCDGRADEGFDLETDLAHCGACGVECRPDNAEPACVGGQCAVQRCRDGAVDLDGDPENGCEYLCRATGEERCNEVDDDCDGAVDEGLDLSGDLFNCGRCGVVCDFANAAAACVDGECRVGDCLPGFVDLDGEPGCEYGCVPRGVEVCNEVDDDCDGRLDEEVDVSADVENCGACGRACAFDNAAALCVEGACRAGDCRPGFVDLDGEPGCEYACQVRGDETCNTVDDDCDGAVDEAFDLTADLQNCGACGRGCAFANADAACIAGQCVPGACDDGFYDIDGLPGCEYACDFFGMETCDGLVDEDCDGAIDEDFDFDSDPTHCGGCGRLCGFVNADASCLDGQCVPGECVDGFLDLDGIPGCEYACVPSVDGIEVCNEVDDDCDGTVDEGLDLDADPENCGRCGRACAAEQAQTACIDGDCRLVACDDGFVDLDGDLDTGCEYACDDDGPEVCDEEDDDCDGMVDEGFDLSADPDNCGLCDLACAFLNAVPLCVDGQCAAGPCTPGFVDLDDLPGCEYACVPSPDGIELCNGADDDCDGEIDERDGDPPLPDCALDRSGEFLVEANPSEQLIGGFLPATFIPAILTLDVQPPDVTGSIDGPDGNPILYVGTIDGDDMDFEGSWAEGLGTVHEETWQVTWDGVDRFTGIMTDRFVVFGQPFVLVWNVTGTRR